jgi:hypothetical protein
MTLIFTNLSYFIMYSLFPLKLNGCTEQLWLTITQAEPCYSGGNGFTTDQALDELERFVMDSLNGKAIRFPLEVEQTPLKVNPDTKRRRKKKKKKTTVPAEPPTPCTHASQYTPHENPLLLQLESAFLGEIKLKAGIRPEEVKVPGGGSPPNVITVPPTDTSPGTHRIISKNTLDLLHSMPQERAISWIFSDFGQAPPSVPPIIPPNTDTKPDLSMMTKARFNVLIQTARDMKDEDLVSYVLSREQEAVNWTFEQMKHIVLKYRQLRFMGLNCHGHRAQKIITTNIPSVYFDRELQVWRSMCWKSPKPQSHHRDRTQDKSSKKIAFAKLDCSLTYAQTDVLPGHEVHLSATRRDPSYSGADWRSLQARMQARRGAPIKDTRWHAPIPKIVRFHNPEQTQSSGSSKEWRIQNFRPKPQRPLEPDEVILTQKQVIRRRQLELHRIKELRAQHEACFQQILQAGHDKLEAQKALLTEAIAAREIEMQRQRENARKNLQQRKENRKLETPHSQQLNPTPVKPAQPDKPRKSPPILTRGSKSTFQPSTLHPSVSSASYIPVPAPSSRPRKKFHRTPRRKQPHGHTQSITTQHPTQSTPTHRKAVKTQPFPSHTTIINHSPCSMSSPTQPPPSNSQHHSWLEPVHRKALRQQPFLDIVNYWFPLGIPRAKGHRGNGRTSGSTTLPLSAQASLLPFALPPRAH